MPPRQIAWKEWAGWGTANANAEQPRDEKGRWVSAYDLTRRADEATASIDRRAMFSRQRPVSSQTAANEVRSYPTGTEGVAKLHDKAAAFHKSLARLGSFGEQRISRAGRDLHKKAMVAHALAAEAHRRESSPSPDLAHEASMRALDDASKLSADHRHAAEEAAVLSERALETGNPAHHEDAADAHLMAASAITRSIRDLTRTTRTQEIADGHLARRAHLRAAGLHGRLSGIMSDETAL